MDTGNNKWYNIQASGQGRDDPATSNKAENEPVWTCRQNGFVNEQILPWKSKCFKIAWKNRNLLEICLEKSKFLCEIAWKNRNALTRIHDPHILNQIDAAVSIYSLFLLLHNFVCQSEFLMPMLFELSLMFSSEM